MKRFFQQTLKLWRDNPLYSGIVVLATALIITFCMVLYMVYSLRTKDVAPEVFRSRTLFTDIGSFYQKGESEQYPFASGMSTSAIKQVYGEVEGLERISYVIDSDQEVAEWMIGTDVVNTRACKGRRVDGNYFQVFQYEFLQGAPFSQEQTEAGSNDLIITDRLARELYGTIDVIGKVLMLNGAEHKVSGVIKEVSSLFTDAYAEVFRPFRPDGFDFPEYDGALGEVRGILLLKPNYPIGKVKEQIAHNLEVYNSTVLSNHDLYLKTKAHTVAEKYFFGGKVNPSMVFGILILLILVVPTINIAGMVSSNLSKRIPEIGIRKVYGATRSSIIGGFFRESLVLTLLGGIIGLLLSYGVIGLFRNEFLGNQLTLDTATEFALPINFFVDIRLLVVVIVLCLLLNTLSVILPAYLATRKEIIQTLKGA
ncbi:hypothetical protein IX308_001387 [Porphyromonas levii]|uniref:ABC transporter permease n=1 Tax=Porphyromonas levii TaxID=28114 RepID=A0A4Y8WQZ1_9PORP|nr:ABC transporter permease [Porphyromonas levii]MBR8766444.1 hypothetical protein [Porphyromonas levii]MBR8785191.1 hypothetical protein [Porphyromonas levii]TFH96720.1 ABC transporter permease [Porphyromonas levii]TFH96888.1 ABC transporter permease [Porphyromonas levii]